MTKVARGYRPVAFWISLALTVTLTGLWVSNLLLVTWINKPAIVAGIVTIWLGQGAWAHPTNVDGKRQPGGCAAIAAFVLLTGLWLGISGVLFLINPREFHSEHPSPSGEHVLVREEDIGGTPTYYVVRHGFFLKKLVTLEGPPRLDGRRDGFEWESEEAVIIEDVSGHYRLNLADGTVTEPE